MIQEAFLMCVAGLIGLAMGPLLARLVIRIPERLEVEWRSQAQEILALEPMTVQHTNENPTRMKAFVIAGFSCALAALATFKFGLSWQALAVIMLFWSLLVATAIDHDHKILPDIIIQPMIWLGLLVNSFSLFCTLQDAFYGAAGGYMAFWLIGRGFELIKGRAGLGDGDFKLIAVFGAWMGWQQLPGIILLASIIGLGVGLLYLRKSRATTDQSFPFGPSIAMAGIVTLLAGSPVQWLGSRFLV
jgi:leader peptidase (prepilin peptidase)/N-methyltransferase